MIKCQCKEQFTHLVHGLFVLDHLLYFFWGVFVDKFTDNRHVNRVFEHGSAITNNQYWNIGGHVLLVKLEIVVYILFLDQSSDRFDIVNSVFVYFTFFHLSFINQ